VGCRGGVWRRVEFQREERQARSAVAIHAIWAVRAQRERVLLVFMTRSISYFIPNVKEAIPKFLGFLSTSERNDVSGKGALYL
jgi:hypothetical protein